MHMVSTETLLSYPDWKIPFMVHTDESDKKLSDVIIQNNKPIYLFLRRISIPQPNYTTTYKEILVTVEYLKQFRVIKFGYEINVFPDNKNMVYNATLSEYEKVMRWQIILEDSENGGNFYRQILPTVY